MYDKIQNYIKIWECRCYSKGLPDTVPDEIFDRAPSYRKIAFAILKNDLSSLGFTGKVSEYYGILKRIELRARYAKHPNPKNKSIQLKLWLESLFN